VKAPLDPRTLSELYLRAVLPCLSELTAHDPEARALVKGWRHQMTFRILQQPGITLDVVDGTVSHHPSRLLYPDFDFAFKDEKHFNGFFAGKNWPPPFLLRGFWRVGKLAAFSKLAARLQDVLEGKPAVIADPAGRILFTRLNLMLGGLGLKVLAEHDPASRAAFASLPRGLAAFAVAGLEGATAWFDNNPGEYEAGWGVPPRHPDVIIRFADPEIAFSALRDECDTLAEVGLGGIQVDGLVPLADGVDLVMARLRDYLEP
jgi:hypothetical protein